MVAGRYSNQHILPLSQMVVSGECHYQPAAQATFSVESDQLDQQLGERVRAVAGAARLTVVHAIASCHTTNECRRVLHTLVWDYACYSRGR